MPRTPQETYPRRILFQPTHTPPPVHITFPPEPSYSDLQRLRRPILHDHFYLFSQARHSPRQTKLTRRTTFHPCLLSSSATCPCPVHPLGSMTSKSRASLLFPWISHLSSRSGFNNTSPTSLLASSGIPGVGLVNSMTRWRWRRPWSKERVVNVKL